MYCRAERRGRVSGYALGLGENEAHATRKSRVHTSRHRGVLQGAQLRAHLLHVSGYWVGVCFWEKMTREVSPLPFRFSRAERKILIFAFGSSEEFLFFFALKIPHLSDIFGHKVVRSGAVTED